MKTELTHNLLAALLGVAFTTTLHAQTLIHYRLKDTDATAVASGSVTNLGTLGNGTNGGTGITLTNDIPTNGVPSDAGNRSIVCDGSGGVLAPGKQQLNNPAIANAGGFTYEAWFKWEGGGDINSIIDYAGTEKLIRSANAAGPEMETDNLQFDSIGAAASNEWHYAAVVFTPTAALDSNTNLTGNYTFYLDSTTPVGTVSNVTINTLGDSLNRSVGVGMHPAGFTSDYFHGLIYEPRVTLGAVPAGDLLFKPHGVVTTVADTGAGSLRDVVTHASSGDVIHFDSSLNGQTITLINGQLTITNDLTIDASALAGGLTISAKGDSRIFLVESNSALTLDALTLRDGFSGNNNPNAGGAILNYGNLTLNACTLTANRAYDGAAIFNWNGGNSTLNECTLSGNDAQRNSGAIGIRGDTVTLNACTVSDNHADLYAGGILVDSDGILVLRNSIVAGNTAGYYDSDLRISSLSGAFSSTSSLTNGDPRLAPLGYYGGPTQTMPPLSSSAAIDAGGSTTFATDQRGFPRVVGSAADIGAVEAIQNFVTNTNDSGAGSLRQTIAEASPGTTVAFDPGLSGQTITLTNGQIIPTNSLIVSASSLSGGITVSGNGNSRIFLVNPDVSLVLDSLNLRDGSAPAGNFFPDNAGGGILNQGNLTVLACTLQNNQATQGTEPGGGGVENSYGTLTINNSTLTENSAGSYGGGIEAVYGQTVIANCTILGNNAPQGGGVASACKIGDPFETRVMNSIITSNSLDNVNFESDFSITNNFVSGGHNLIGNGEALPSFNQAGDLTNTAPLLAPLGNYGGPTLTMPPLPGSPAIEGGGRVNALPGDQRGAARPAGYYPDIGAVEAFPFTAIPLVDTDGDGMDDRMELGYFGNLTTATTNSDFDHDGSSDRDELGNMTDPTDPASLFKIDHFAYYAPGTNGPVYGVDFTSFPGLSYTIEHDRDPSFSAPQTENVGVVNDYESGVLIELNSDHEFIRVRRNPIIN